MAQESGSGLPKHLAYVDSDSGVGDGPPPRGTAAVTTVVALAAALADSEPREPQAGPTRARPGVTRGTSSEADPGRPQAELTS